MNVITNTKAGANKIEVVVHAIEPLNELVTRFEFKRANGMDFPPFSAGAHTVIEMQDTDKKHLNPYSLMSNPSALSTYAISVRRDDEGRGGSLFMHHKVSVGDPMRLSYPVNLFSLDLRANKHIFIAGGIGITPFMAMIAQLGTSNEDWALHYACRSKPLATYAASLKESHGRRVNVYLDDKNQTIDLAKVLSGQRLGTHLYICGPAGMINWVKNSALNAGWSSANVHYEEFLAPQPGQAFQVQLCQSNRTIDVSTNESLLEALEREGVNPPYLCRGGACGQCETDVVEFDGKFDHRDHWLEVDERASGKKIMPCVSRFIGNKLVLDR